MPMSLFGGIIVHAPSVASIRMLRSHLSWRKLHSESAQLHDSVSETGAKRNGIGTNPYKTIFHRQLTGQHFRNNGVRSSGSYRASPRGDNLSLKLLPGADKWSHLPSLACIVREAGAKPAGHHFRREVLPSGVPWVVWHPFQRMVPIENGDLVQWSPEATVTVTSNDDEDEPDQLVGLDLTSVGG